MVGFHNGSLLNFFHYLPERTFCHLPTWTMTAKAEFRKEYNWASRKWGCFGKPKNTPIKCSKEAPSLQVIFDVHKFTFWNLWPALPTSILLRKWAKWTGSIINEALILVSMLAWCINYQNIISGLPLRWPRATARALSVGYFDGVAPVRAWSPSRCFILQPKYIA